MANSQLPERASLARFFEACSNGDVETLRGLLTTYPRLAQATNPDAPHEGRTGLHAAAQRGHVDVVRLLLEQGADPNAREAGDNTYPRHWAAVHEHLDVGRALLDAGGDVNGVGDVRQLGVIGSSSRSSSLPQPLSSPESVASITRSTSYRTSKTCSTGPASSVFAISCATSIVRRHRQHDARARNLCPRH